MIDARTDLFALGTILHEMATGRRSFEAATEASLTKAILETAPPAVATLSPQAPPALDHVVQGCLAKHPVDRWQTAHDVKLQLQWIEKESSRIDAAAPAIMARRRTAWVPWTAAAVFAALIATALLLSPRLVMTQQAVPARFDLILPPEMRQEDDNSGAISPDGRRFVFEATVDGRRRLVLRDMASAALVVLAGTEYGFNPFWSPDSRSVAFFDNGHLKQVPVTGGPVRVLADMTYIEVRPARAELGPGPFAHGTWGPGVILFGSSKGGILSRPGDGREGDCSRGAAVEARTEQFCVSQVPARWPALPGHRCGRPRPVCCLARDHAHAENHGGRLLGRVRGGPPALLPGRRSVRARLRFQRLEFSGPEVVVAEQADDVSVSDNGTIVYRPAGVSVSRLTWFDRRGQRTGTLGEPASYEQVGPVATRSPCDGRAGRFRGEH